MSLATARLLLDIEMPDRNGFEICADFKRDPVLRDIPIVFVSGRDRPEDEIAALDAGAEDFITKPPRIGQVVARVRTRLALKRAQDELRQTARTDALTGLANRRHFDDQFDREWSRANRSGLPLSLLVLDIDYFKNFNEDRALYVAKGGGRAHARFLSLSDAAEPGRAETVVRSRDLLLVG